ncbi:hypothetical protein L3Y34_007100 [Caenorhabditis briggsae]|uniref:Glycosyltransferase family 92 protein n=1 Tax=Caenorhabditis briggsae TaxID=6238 RepID=A0AAE8ZYC6_CAEBR|nr:hypothetical protein L3Y34_007100 [Caenorhabditis briggsae]
MIRKLSVSHAFVVSAYYYPKSSLLGNNAIALNVVFDSVSHNLDHVIMIGTNDTEETQFVARTQVESSEACRYATTVATANTVENLTKLEIESNDHKIEIQFKIARYNAPKPVIFCLSPQSLAEQWQLFMIQAHMSQRFGAHIHLYLTSSLESYFGLLREYEKQGYITIENWLRIKFSETTSPYFEPNANMELANRAGAYADCLLQYKEAAKYVAFLDLEDFIFPVMRTTYLREFNAEFEYQLSASSILYTTRDHLLVKAESLEEFSFYDIVASLKTMTTSLKIGKVVVRADRYNLTSIYGNMNTNDRNRYTVTNNMIVRVQSAPDQTNDTTQNDYSFSSKIRPKDLLAIEESIWRMKNFSSIDDLSARLPRFDFYTPILSECLFATQEGNRKGKNCMNFEKCAIPQREDFKCVHSDAEYKSGPHIEPFTFHYAHNSFWSDDMGCHQ